MVKVSKRRRREGKTDYRKRIKLLSSESPRLIFRKTNRYIISQYVTSKEAQDKIEMNVNSKSLIKYGWPESHRASLKSIPASYLTGMLIGKKIIKNKLKTPILDSGMYRTLHKTRVFAFLKGLIDSGIKMKYKEGIFPDEERLKGKHLKKDFSEIFDKIKSKIEKE